MARRGAFLLTAALLVAEVYLALLPYRSPSPHHPAPRLRRVAGLPPLPPLQLSRSLPEHGTLTAPCDRNSEYVNERLAWLWGQAQEGQDWASQCCLCLPCTGPSSANTCTSQFGQDLFLFRNFFRCLPETGLYVDVGAHHPKQLSNSYMLDVCLGWGGGVCVEASDEYSALIVGSRSCRVVHAAAASRDGGELYLGSAGARSETRSSGGGQRVRAATLATLLREANVTIGDGRTGEMVIIDLLTIDVEGDELEALIGLPWDSVWARIVMVENVRASQDVFEFLMDKGYVKFASLSVDDFYFKVSGVPLSTSSDLNYHRQSTAAMRKLEMGLETYEHKVLYSRQWEHLRILWGQTGEIPEA